MALGYVNKIPIYPKFYLLKEDYGPSTCPLLGPEYLFWQVIYPYIRVLGVSWRDTVPHVRVMFRGLGIDTNLGFELLRPTFIRRPHIPCERLRARQSPTCVFFCLVKVMAEAKGTKRARDSSIMSHRNGGLLECGVP